MGAHLVRVVLAVATAAGVGPVAGCSWTTASTVGPFVRDVAIDTRHVHVTSCALVLERERSLVEVRPVRSAPGVAGDDGVGLRDGACATSSAPRRAGALR